MGGNIEAYFPHPEWGMAHQEFQRDIKAQASGSDMEWPMTVSSTLTNANFTITWNILSIPQNYQVVLTDDSNGQQADMRSESSYDFLYSDVTSFRINVTELDTDSDSDGIADDGDGNGTVGDNPCTGGNTANCDDNCINTSNPDQTDSDSDGVGDVCDNCRLVANTDQMDSNSSEDDNLSVAGIQHYGNICDPDFDNDGLVKLSDFSVWRQYYRQFVPPAPEYVDLNGDGKISLSDFSIWRQYYRSSPGPGIGD
jgi:hypothetical protein